MRRRPEWGRRPRPPGLSPAQPPSSGGLGLPTSAFLAPRIHLSAQASGVRQPHRTGFSSRLASWPQPSPGALGGGRQVSWSGVAGCGLCENKKPTGPGVGRGGLGRARRGPGGTQTWATYAHTRPPRHGLSRAPSPSRARPTRRCPRPSSPARRASSPRPRRGCRPLGHMGHSRGPRPGALLLWPSWACRGRRPTSWVLRP